MPAANDGKTVITLKGSAEIVSEFFFTAINSILYQRGIYQPEEFRRETKYGLTVLTTTDEGLLAYLRQVMGQMKSWLLDGHVQRLVLVVTGVDSGETLERWQFNVHVDNESSSSQVNNENSSASHHNIQRLDSNGSDELLKKKRGGKAIKEIHDEIQAIIRQITASVTFLPLLNESCSFDLLVYTSKTAMVPKKWEESDPRYIMNSHEVKLRSFTTSIHKVESMVTYKEKDEWEL